MCDNGVNDPILLSRGTSEESKMCRKDDTANSPATGQVSTHIPVSLMSTPLDSCKRMDVPTKDFMNALTGGTGVPVKTLFYENERGFDEQLRAQLKANSKNIYENNKEWWNKLSLDNFYPLGEAHPYDTPNTYANLTFYLQRQFNNSNTTQAIFKRQMNEDGIFARETFAVLYQLAVVYPKNKKELIKLPKLHKLVTNLSLQLHNLNDNKETAELVQALQDHLLTVIVKPEIIVKWNYQTSISSLINLYRYNNTREGQGFYLDTSFFPIIRYLSQNDSEAEHIAEMLTFEQKLDMLSTLYGEQDINTSAVYFEVKRNFTHYEDLLEVNPKKQYKEFSLNFMLNNGQFVDEAEPILKIKFPNWALVTKSRERSRHIPQLFERDMDKGNQKHPAIISLALFHYLPKINAKQKEAAKALINLYVMETNVEQQAAMNLLRELEADVVRRKALPADISDYKTLMDVLTYRVASKGLPTAGLRVLMERAETSYFLTVKLEGNTEAFILTYRQIVESNNKAIYNDSYPMKIGDFKPPSKSPVHLDDSNLRAKREEEFIHVVLIGLYQPWNERRFNFFEPVRIDIGVLDPDVGTATEFYRDTFGDRVWHVETQWHLSDSLPEVIPEIRKQLDKALSMKGIDLIVTSLSLALTFAGSLLKVTGTTLLGGIGVKAIVPLSRSLLNAVFWFVLSEYLVAKMMAFDKIINTDKENYDDNDRALWNTFKIGLFILGGAMVIRQAWKGLKFAGSKIFASSLSELELELLKKATMRPLPAKAIMTRMLSAKTALTVSKKWANEALALTASTLRDLTEEAVTRLKQLPEWSLYLIKEMKDEVIRKLFGCASFCIVDLTVIKDGLIDVVVNKLKIDNIKGILAVEREMLRNLSFEAWDRIIKYAVRNRNYFSVKGKIAEELFSMKSEFRSIFEKAMVNGEARGIHFADIQFVNHIKGWAPKTTRSIQKGVWAELTDGMIVGVKRNAGGVQGKDELHILAVFESKSPSNLDQLAKGKWQNSGQMAWDYERMSENSVKIIFNGEEKIFTEDAINISRKTTQWVGVLPPGYKMSSEMLKHLQAALPNAQFIEGPVRNEILNELAKALKRVINYQPK